MVTWGRLRPASGSGPVGCFARAGLRWCGGWRRINLGGSHDQTQIQAEGCDPLNRPKDRQISRAIGPRVVQAGNGHSTKHARINAMLRTPAGTTIASLVTATGWQQHSVYTGKRFKNFDLLIRSKKRHLFPIAPVLHLQRKSQRNLIEPGIRYEQRIGCSLLLPQRPLAPQISAPTSNYLAQN